MVKPLRVAILFPGQGSQYVGMGKDLAEKHPQAAAAFQKANDVLGVDLRKICFEGPGQNLILTHNNQPAILATSIACWEVFHRQGLSIELVGAAGLSLGEYTALVAARSLSYDDALKLVRARGTFMQEACDRVPSAMASVMGLDMERVRELCRGVAGNGSSMVLDIANVNCPGQIVISGDRDAIREACDRVSKMESARASILNVSGAFHSRLMQPAADKLRAVVRDIRFAVPEIPVISNVTGEKIGMGDNIAELLIRQITSPVLWERCVRFLLSLQPDLFLEMGSGRVLSGLLRKIDRSAKSFNIEDAESLQRATEQIGLMQSSSRL